MIPNHSKIKNSNRYVQKMLINIKLDKLIAKYKSEYGNDEKYYRKIIYDNVVKGKWNNIVKSPFINNVKDEQILQLYDLIIECIDDENLFKQFIINSLTYRK